MKNSANSSPAWRRMRACRSSRSMARIWRMNSIANSRLRAGSLISTSAGRPIGVRWVLPDAGASDRFDIRPVARKIATAHETGGGGMFTGVKVFSATKAKERDDLGEQVTRWLRANADLEIVDRTVVQSSDNELHCLTAVLFYTPRNAAAKP